MSGCPDLHGLGASWQKWSLRGPDKGFGGQLRFIADIARRGRKVRMFIMGGDMPREINSGALFDGVKVGQL